MSAAAQGRLFVIPGRRLLVCGGRDFADEGLLREVLDRLLFPDPVLGQDWDRVIHGDCPTGADALAQKYVEDNHLVSMRYPILPHEVHREGYPDGCRRNARMLRESEPTHCVAFPTPRSTGTWNMIRLAREAGLEPEIHLSG